MAGTVGNEREKSRHFWRLSIRGAAGELNPGPMTEPSVFYVRSLLAIWRFSAPIDVADN